MTMPENKIVEMLLLQHFPAVNDQPFLLLTQEDRILGAGDRPAAAAKPARQPHPDGRWQEAEQGLAGPVAKDLLDELIAMVAGSQSIPMTDIESLPIVLEHLWLMIDGDIQLFLEITLHPHIVIPERNGWGCPNPLSPPSSQGS